MDNCPQNEIDYIVSLSDTVLVNSRRESIRIGITDGLSDDRISEFERAYDICLPKNLRNIYRFSNGINLFGFEIDPLEATEVFADEGLIAIHNWGNGDMDCIALDDRNSYTMGNIVFVNHNPDVAVKIAASVCEWFRAIIEEIGESGEVLHPRDYRNRSQVKGVYSKVLQALRGIDCELNR